MKTDKPKKKMKKSNLIDYKIEYICSHLQFMSERYFISTSEK